MEKTNLTKQAEFLGISVGYLSKILSKKATPRPDMAKDLAAKTDSDPSIWVFGTKEEKNEAIKQAMETSVNVL